MGPPRASGCVPWREARLATYFFLALLFLSFLSLLLFLAMVVTSSLSALADLGFAHTDVWSSTARDRADGFSIGGPAEACFVRGGWSRHGGLVRYFHAIASIASQCSTPQAAG